VNSQCWYLSPHWTQGKLERKFSCLRNLVCLHLTYPTMQWKCSNASDCVTSQVMDSGDVVTCTISICEGNFLHHALTMLYGTGRDITKQLIKLLLLRRFSFPCLLQNSVLVYLKGTCALSYWTHRKRYVGGNSRSWNNIIC
jgi:hypothetical protein